MANKFKKMYVEEITVKELEEMAKESSPAGYEFLEIRKWAITVIPYV